MKGFKTFAGAKTMFSSTIVRLQHIGERHVYEFDVLLPICIFDKTIFAKQKLNTLFYII